MPKGSGLARARKSRSLPGSIFFLTRPGAIKELVNLSLVEAYYDDGDECGGLIYGGDKGSGNAGAALLFDRLKQDQVIGIMYQEAGGQYRQGLFIWDRPDTPLTHLVDRMKEIEAIQDDEERKRKMAELNTSGEAGAPRLFAGRARDGSSSVMLMDSKGRPRIRIAVDKDDNPVIEVLNAEGKVIWSLVPQ